MTRRLTCEEVGGIAEVVGTLNATLLSVYCIE